MNSVILGAGNYGEMFLSFLREEGINIVGFLDDNPNLQNKEVCGVPVLGTMSMLKDLRNQYNVDSVYCPIGNNPVRVRLLTEARELGYETPNYIHRLACVGPDVKMGTGVYVIFGTNIMPHATLEDFVMLSMNVGVGHHSVLEKGVFLSSGCNFGGSIRAKQYAYCGMGTTIMSGVHELGEDCLIGAGAVVIRDVPDKAVVAGVPAKILRYKE